MGRVSQEQVEQAARAPLKYFTHDSRAGEEARVRRLLRRCGWEGYGRFWRLCEMLAAEEGHELDVSDEEGREILAESLGLDVEGLGDLLCDLAGCGLLEMPGTGLITAPVVDETARYFGRKRAAAARGGSRGKAGE